MLSKILGDSIKSKVLGKGSKLEAVTAESKTSPSLAVLNITAKNFLLLPTIARDVNVARQAMIALVKLAGGKSTNKADAQMLKAGERSKKFEVKSGVTQEDGDGLGNFLKKKVKKSFKKWFKKTRLGKAIRKMKIGMKKLVRKFKKMGLKLLKKIFNKALLKTIFSPKNIAKILFKVLRVAGPVGLVITIVGSIVNGAIDAWNTWQDTGSIWESLKAGLGGILEFATFGIIDKQFIDNLTDGIGEMIAPLVDGFTEFYDNTLNWIGDKWDSLTAWITGDEQKPTIKKQPIQKEQEPEKPGPSKKEIEAKWRKEKAAIRELLLIRNELKFELTQLEYDLEAVNAELESVVTGQPVKIPSGPPGTPSTSATPTSPQPQQPSTAGTAPSSPTPAPTPSGETPQPKPEGASTSGIFSDENSFVKALKPWAEYVSQAIGGKVPPLAILGQWAGESGVGKSLPADYNYAGIKAGKTFQKGDFVLTEERYTDAQIKKAQASGEELEKVITSPQDKIKKKGRLVTIDEWFGAGAFQKARDEGKNWVQVKSYFAKFKDLKDFADSFASFISSPRYAKAREQTTASGFGYEIAKAGYATASPDKYSAKVSSFEQKYSAPSGTAVAQNSKDVSQGQREQLKPTDANVINVQKTNNTTVAVNETKTRDTNQGQAASTLVGRAA